ncbi:hypothetical protein J6590_086396 [Homalodisca vitripennis]|nr:hypothetical protein J6590_086396 [Homalodisca vitripennis]
MDKVREELPDSRNGSYKLYSKASERVAEALLAINEPLTSPTRCHSLIDLKELNYRNTFYSITTTRHLNVSVNIQVLAEKTPLSPTQPSSGLPSLGTSVQSRYRQERATPYCRETPIRIRFRASLLVLSYASCAPITKAGGCFVFRASTKDASRLVGHGDIDDSDGFRPSSAANQIFRDLAADLQLVRRNTLVSTHLITRRRALLILGSKSQRAFCFSVCLYDHPSAHLCDSF